MLIFSAAALAQAPRSIPFSGILKNAAGRPITNSSQQINVTLYDAATGGTAIYTETLTVSVTNGLFTGSLGAATPIPSSVNFAYPYWLGIKIAGESSEMTPRIRLQAVPYAAGLAAPITVVNTQGPTGLYVQQANTSSNQPAIWGTVSTSYAIGVFGTSNGDAGSGIEGVCYGAGGIGVYGQSSSGPGVFGSCASGTGRSQAGVYGTSQDAAGNGVVGEVSGVDAFAVWGYNPSGTAGRFDGNLYVSGTIRNGSDQATVAPESLRIIRGIVDAQGALYRGTGYTVSKTGTGQFHIVWATPFSDIPTMTVTPNVGGCGLTAGEFTYAATADVWIGSGSTPVDYGFQFIAIGPK
jgi:hypothetical protein